MADHNKPTEPQTPSLGRLSGVKLMPGVSVTIGTPSWSALDWWEREKHFEKPDEKNKVRVEELKNGDLRISTANGFTRIVYAWAVAWKLYEPEGRK